MLYFLTGSTPIRFIVKRRRLVYLHHILKQEEESLIMSFFEKQLLTRKLRDWSPKILKDLSDFGMSNYLTSQTKNIPIKTAKFIAKIQSHMVETVSVRSTS